MTFIQFNEQAYPLREITIGTLSYIIATESLWHAIEAQQNEEANKLDEKIFFYVMDKLIILSDKELADYVKRQL